MKQQTDDNKNNTGKYVLIGLGIMGVATGGFFLIRHLLNKGNDNSSGDFTTTFDPNAIVPIEPSSKGSGSSTASSGFPLQKGSSGTLVKSLQEALIKQYGNSILPKYGADGSFGSETVTALQSKGLPTVIDANTYTSILATPAKTNTASGDNTTSDNASGQLETARAISSYLHKSITSNRLDIALAALNKIKSVQAYKLVNEFFKAHRIGGVRKTIVTGLLQHFFNTGDKNLLNAQFERIGLQYNDGKWSLSGLGTPIIQIKSIKKCKVWNAKGQSMMVPEGTVLGEYIDSGNGVTEFITLDDKILFTNTKSISTVS